MVTSYHKEKGRPPMTEVSRPYLFAKLFIQSNRLTTACERIQEEVTIKQWLLLAIVAKSSEDLNFTQLGEIMGCSRQNVRKLANQLENKGFAKIQSGANRSQYLELTEHVQTLEQQDQLDTLNQLFKEFRQADLQNLMELMHKLDKGIQNVEDYAHEHH